MAKAQSKGNSLEYVRLRKGMARVRQPKAKTVQTIPALLQHVPTIVADFDDFMVWESRVGVECRGFDVL